MSTHNIGFYAEMVKIIFQLLSNMHSTFSSVETFWVVLGLRCTICSQVLSFGLGLMFLHVCSISLWLFALFLFVFLTSCII